MELRSRHILTAVVVALMLHVAALLALVLSADRVGAIGSGRGGMDISMGAVGGSPPSAGAVDAPLTDTLSPAEAMTDAASDPADSEAPAEAPDTIQPEAAALAEAPVDATPDVTAPVEDALTAVETPVETPVEQAVPPAASTIAAALPEAVVESADEAVEALGAVEVDRIATATAIRAPDRAPEATVQPTLDPSLDQVDAAATEPATAVTAEPVPTDADVVPTEVEQTVETARLRPAETVTATTSAPEATPVETAMPAPPRRPRDLAPARTRTPTRTASTRPDPTPARTTPQRETRRAPTPAEEPAPTRPTPDTQTASRGDPTAAPREDAGSGSTAGASGGSGDNSGPAASQSAGGDPGARRDYLARIVAILSGIRDRYPRAARRRNLEGTGQLYLAIQADGSIGAWRLTSSTGHTILDDTIMDYRARVSFPPIPEELNRPTFVIEVPITFETR